MGRFIVILFSVLAPITSSRPLGSFDTRFSDAMGPSAQGEICPDTHAWTGEYRNFSYGFTIVIPKGYKGFWNSARCVSDGKNCTCMSDHGRIIPLSGEPYEEERHVEAYASHGAELNEPTVTEAVKRDLSSVSERSKPASVRVLKQAKINLAGQPGSRVLVQYYDKKIQRWFLEDFVEVLKDGDRFSLYLRTPRNHYKKDKPIFEAVLTSFKFKKSDKEPIEVQ